MAKLSSSDKKVLIYFIIISPHSSEAPIVTERERCLGSISCYHISHMANVNLTFPYFSYLFFPKENKKKPSQCGGKDPIALEYKIWIGTRCGKNIRQHDSVDQQ